MAKKRLKRKRLKYAKRLQSVRTRACPAPVPAPSGNIVPSSRESTGVPGTVIIFKSEMDFISRCILDYPSIETGGQLFGYYTESGTPVVLYAIGPGANANHQVAFFNQDIGYLTTVGAKLKDLFGLHHIGEWHSHHHLGLARPSGHDASTMVGTIREKGLGRFLLCIGNCDATGTTLNPFPCDSSDYVDGNWDIISVTILWRKGTSPCGESGLIVPACRAMPGGVGVMP